MKVLRKSYMDIQNTLDSCEVLLPKEVVVVCYN